MVLLILALVPFAHTLNMQHVYAKTQHTSTISIMTMANMSNNNVTQSQAIENKTINYYDNATGYLVYPSSN